MADSTFQFPATRRRALLGAGASLLGGAMLPGLRQGAWAADQPPIGTWPAGASGDSVFVGISLPRTGTYAVPGEDELKGVELAIEHINTGNDLIRKIAPNIKKGVLGKQIKHGVADSEAKPNTAVQNATKFINDDKAIMICGCVSSAEAVALNKLAQREHVIYLPLLSGSNDTTGKDCVRYSFRQCFYAQTAAAALTPVIITALGKNKKIAFLTPDYTYGHTVRQSFETEHQGTGRLDRGDQPGLPAGRVGLQLLPAEHRQQRRRRVHQHQLRQRRHAVDQAGQAVRRAGQDDAGGGVQHAVPGARCRAGPDAGRVCVDRLLVDAGGRFPLAKEFVAEFEKKYNYKPDWSANSGYMSLALWADAVERAKTFYPPAVIKSYEAGKHVQSTVGEVWFRPEDHQFVRPVIIQRGKKKSDMQNPDDYYEIIAVVPGEGLMQKPDAFGCHLGDYT